MPELEIIPAVLVKTREELLAQIDRVRPFVKSIQIDVMDGKFVPNKTIGFEELADLPRGPHYEFHWMVKDPENWIPLVPGPYLHIVHIETITSFQDIRNIVREAGGALGLAFNPDTPLEKVLQHGREVRRLMAMTVNPGFAGQKYIGAVEGKIRQIRENFPSMDIEVDGGINLQTIAGAVKAGANKLAAASSIIGQPDIGQAVAKLQQVAMAAKEESIWATG